MLKKLIMKILNPIISTLKSFRSQTSALDSRSLGFHNFYSPGKIMLTGEYLVLDGASSLALPTMLGQSLNIKSKKTFSSPTLNWTGLDYQYKKWVGVKFRLNDFSIIDSTDSALGEKLQSIFRAVRQLNIHFLREEKEYFVTSKVEFPLNWGLGSSSTLLFNISQWAYVSPFELSRKTFGGSGYDIAVAEAKGPVIYKTEDDQQEWKLLNLNFPFKDSLFFVHLKEKKNTQSEIKYYNSLERNKDFQQNIDRISEITTLILKCSNLEDFQKYVAEHEDIISRVIKRQKVKDLYFKDFQGEVKSLGAWGGDFALAVSSLGPDYINSYFNQLGYDTVIAYKDLITDSSIFLK